MSCSIGILYDIRKEIREESESKEEYKWYEWLEEE